MGLAWLRGFFREGDNAGQSNARDARHPDRMLRNKQSRNPIERRKGPCQDDDGGQNLYSDAPRFFDPADLASIRLIVNSQHEVSLLKGSDAVTLGSTAGGPSSAKMQFAARRYLAGSGLAVLAQFYQECRRAEGGDNKLDRPVTRAVGSHIDMCCAFHEPSLP
ncbi:hypothetical protein LA080_009326 [Diaporthe eres]|nr:hypothetical protein LA080_009326 [Diaporthe eres]